MPNDHTPTAADMARDADNDRFVIHAEAEVERLRAAVRAHRDERGDNRCWLDDETLYRVLPEGFTPPARDSAVELERCKAFIASRHHPVTDYVSPQGRIEELEAERDKLQAFKTWVHAYLDAHGVPHHPPGTHGAEGCRIGDRMDWLMERLRTAESRAAAMESVVLDLEWKGQTNFALHCPVCRILKGYPHAANCALSLALAIGARRAET